MSDRSRVRRLAVPDDCGSVIGAFWKPNREFVDELAAYLKGRKVLEVFAGNGYLAALLTQRGVVVTATTRFAGHDSHEIGLYHDVEELEAVEAVQRYGASHDVLLMSWPTVTPAALHAVHAWGTEREIGYVGEVTDYSKGQLAGSATDRFFEQMVFHHKFESYRGNMWESALVGRYRED